MNSIFFIKPATSYNLQKTISTPKRETETKQKIKGQKIEKIKKRLCACARVRARVCANRNDCKHKKMSRK